MVEGAEEDAVRGEEDVAGRGGVSQDFQGATDPCVEVGLAAPFEFQEAERKGIRSCGYREVVAQVIVRAEGISIYYSCLLQRHGAKIGGGQR